jgi:hypothetical protein
MVFLVIPLVIPSSIITKIPSTPEGLAASHGPLSNSGRVTTACPCAKAMEQIANVAARHNGVDFLATELDLTEPKLSSTSP